MDVKNNPCEFVLFVLFLCFSLKIILSHGADTISVNQSLSGNQTIISAGGVFELGFFNPGNSSNFYIGMWFKQVSIPTIVWVANRETPISDKYSSEFKILDGNLVLLNESQIPIWSTNLNSSTSNSIQAVLNDTGNFVLRDGANSSSEPFWQSFDHPTDTWFPGAKLGIDKRTNTSMPLTAWKNLENPAPGLYSMDLDPNGTNQYFIMWNRTEIYWKSGAWNGEFFDLVPGMIPNSIFNFTASSNENGSYFYFNVKDPTTTSKVAMDVSGLVKEWTRLPNGKQWNLFRTVPRHQCEVYALCGIYGTCNEVSKPFCHCLKGFEPKLKNDWNLEDYSGGCMRKTPLQCENSSTARADADRFLVASSMKWPKHQQSGTVGSALECESACLNNCSCSAYAFDSNGCTLWFEDLLNLQQVLEGDSDGKTLYIKLAASEFPSSRNNTGKVIGIVVGSVAGVVVLFGLVLVVFLKLKRSTGRAKAAEGSLVLFGYRELQKATKNFTEKLGGGSFGSVFKGTLSDSTVIAVKKLESISQGEKQFRTEVSTIGIIQHVNLVRFRGLCSEGTKKLLVYDYMTNGSLEAHLFHEKDGKILAWKTRYQIALGTARGLVYLHEKCRYCIIHCDIKPENILLDAEFCPKLADFGLAKILGREFSRVLTTMRGTRGYLAPEWISGVAITPKTDVYSYGMMLFELISGRRNWKLQSEDGDGEFFPTFAARKITTEGEDILSLLDQRLEENVDVEELTRVCRVACWCIQDDETQRPSISQVVQILEGVLDVSLPPIPWSLQLLVNNLQDDIIFFTKQASSHSSQAQRNGLAASS